VNWERLVLMRHGETVGDSVIRYFGRTNVELSVLGRAQMRAARKLIRSELAPGGFDQIFASRLQRATEGARIIAGDDAKIVEIDEFAEVDFGDFEGLTSEEIRERFPAEYARWNRDRLSPDFTYPHGENRADFMARVERGIDRILTLLKASHTGSWTALLVAHRGVIRVIMRQLTGLEPVIELGSIQIVERVKESGWRATDVDLLAPLAK